MAIIAGDRVVVGDDRSETFDELGKLRRRDGGVLDERNRLFVPLRPKQSQSGFLTPQILSPLPAECRAGGATDLLFLS